MTARPVRAASRGIAAPRRFVLAGATGGLITLASAGTAVLVLTGTSAVAPPTAQVPPLPAPAPVAGDPGVVVLPTPVSARPVDRPLRPVHVPVAVPVARRPAARTAPVAVPVVLPIPTAAKPPAVAVPAVPAVAAPAPVPAADPSVRPALRGSGATADPTTDGPAHGKGRHAKHPKHAKPGKHGKHGGAQTLSVPPPSADLGVSARHGAPRD